jgi:hypothetical protein
VHKKCNVLAGNTGEEYVRHLHNAVVLDTDDPEEAAWYIGYLDRRADDQAHLRERARETALRFAWGRVIEELLARAAFVAARQGAPDERTRTAWSRTAKPGRRY